MRHCSPCVTVSLSPHTPQESMYNELRPYSTRPTTTPTSWRGSSPIRPTRLHPRKDVYRRVGRVGDDPRHDVGVAVSWNAAFMARAALTAPVRNQRCFALHTQEATLTMSSFDRLWDKRTDGQTDIDRQRHTTLDGDKTFSPQCSLNTRPRSFSWCLRFCWCRLVQTFHETCWKR